MKKYLFIPAAICLSLSLLSGCGGGSSSSTQKPENNETVEASATQNDKAEKSEEKAPTNDSDKPKDVGILSKNKKLSDGSTAYLDGNTCKIVSEDEGNEYVLYYVYDNNKLTIYSEIECEDEETAKLICDMFNSQAEEDNLYDVHTEGSKVCMQYNEAFIDTYSSYVTAEQIYNAME